MGTLSVVDRAGNPVGEFEYKDELLRPKASEAVVHSAVVGYLANMRQGTVHCKVRNEVEGSTRKLFRQKGTGRARMGAIRTPIRRGGGKAFGPSPRDFSHRVPKKVRLAALAHALASRVAEGRVVLAESLAAPSGKTKEAAALLAALGVTGRVLIALPERDEMFIRAARNIRGVSLKAASDVNALDVLRHGTLLTTREGFEAMLARIGRVSTGGAHDA